MCAQRSSIQLAAASSLLALTLGAGEARAQISRPAYDEVFYHFMPIAWRDSNNDQYRYGDFNGMTASLDYLQSLGVTAVWMNPIYPSPAYHGYHHRAPSTVNSWFGVEADFFNFVAQAHARGIKVFVDLVVYGVNRDDIYFQSANANPASPYDSWLAFTNSGNTQYTGSTYTTWSNATVRFINWDLRDSTNAGATRNQVITWSRHWLDPNNDGNPSDGIDGFRLDHVWVQYGTGPDGWGYNLDDFWTPWHNSLRQLNPQFFSFAEQADWGSYGAEFLPVFNAALAKPMLFAIRDAVNAQAAAGVTNSILATLAQLPSDAEANNRAFMASLGDHDVDRFTSVTGNNLGRARVAAAILMTQPFTPMMYYGDEIGMLGTKGNWGSDANDIPLREPFKWNAVAGPPMSNYFLQNTSAYNGRFSQNNDGRSVQEQQGVSGSLLETYRSLIAVRRNSAALKRGTFTPIGAGNAGVFSCFRHADALHAGPQGVLVAVNMTGAAVTTTLNLSSLTIAGGSTTPTALFGSALPAITTANKASYPITLPAYSSVIAQADLTPPPPGAVWNINGTRDADAPLRASNAGLSLYAGVKGDDLYVSTNKASSANDRFIVIALDPGPGALSPAPWAKSGQAADWACYLGNEVDSNWCGWFDQGSSLTRQASATDLEGTVNLRQLNGGTLPAGVWIAVTSYPTADGTALIPALQVPASINANTTLDSGEYIHLTLCQLDPTQCCPSDLDDGSGTGAPNAGVDISDLLYFLAQFEQGNAAIDLDNGSGTGTPDGGVDISDLLYFLSHFEAGC